MFNKTTMVLAHVVVPVVVLISAKYLAKNAIKETLKGRYGNDYVEVMKNRAKQKRDDKLNYTI